MRKVLHVTPLASDTRRLVYESRGSWSVVVPSDPANVPALIADQDFDFILFDIALTGVWVPDLLAAINAVDRRPPLFILSREYSFCFLEYSRTMGACGYFHVPYDFSALRERIDRFFDAASLPADPTRQEVDLLVDTLLGTSPAMTRLRSEIVNLRARRDPVLIRGETGCGKDLVARLLHRNSPVAEGSYKAMNVSCLPFSLADGLLFGTAKGAFTDSINAPGLFEQADGGTAFLDEIGDLDPALQPKLLRVLEDGLVTRLGATEPKGVSFRLVCATNRDLDAMVASRAFRADLFYRIDVIRMHIPPLRDHREDIPLLAGSCLTSQGKVLSSNALDKLHGYHWPGNVRQLFGCLSRAASSCEGEVIYPEQIRF